MWLGKKVNVVVQIPGRDNFAVDPLPQAHDNHEYQWYNKERNSPQQCWQHKTPAS
jgi:hypothetical protein